MRLSPTLADKAHFRLPGKEEMQQFYAEFAAHGWKDVVIPVVPSNYAQQGTELVGSDQRKSTLYGDVDGDGHPDWVVACYVATEPVMTSDPQDSMSGMPGGSGGAAVPIRDDRARLGVFTRDGAGRWKLRWKSPGLGYEFRPPKYNLWEVSKGLDQPENLRPCISLVDVDGDRCLEIVYHCWSQTDSVGGLPGVLRHDGSRWVSVAPQADRFSLQDVNHDGRLEVITASPFVGFGSGDDDVPRVWRWNGRQYQEASSEFPMFYKELASRYEAFIRRMQTRGEEFKKSAWERALQKAASLAG